jgi:hypothetical protein
MRALIVAALAALLLAQPASAQDWVAAIAQAEPWERAAMARRAAEAELGPGPRDGSAAQSRHHQRVMARQEELFRQAEDFRERLLAPGRREDEHARLRIICEGQARQARDYWPAFHSCWAQHSRR